MIGKPFEISAFGETFEVVLVKGIYQSNKCLALTLKEANGMPFSTLSANFPESAMLPKDHFYGKHWSENEGLLEQLEEKGLIEKVPNLGTISSGFIENIHAYKLIK